MRGRRAGPQGAHAGPPGGATRGPYTGPPGGVTLGRAERYRGSAKREGPGPNLLLLASNIVDRRECQGARLSWGWQATARMTLPSGLARPAVAVRVPRDNWRRGNLAESRQ
jgi:hypothetical protein